MIEEDKGKERCLCDLCSMNNIIYLLLTFSIIFAEPNTGK